MQLPNSFARVSNCLSTCQMFPLPVYSVMCNVPHPSCWIFLQFLISTGAPGFHFSFNSNLAVALLFLSFSGSWVTADAKPRSLQSQFACTLLNKNRCPSVSFWGWPYGQSTFRVQQSNVDLIFSFIRRSQPESFKPVSFSSTFKFAVWSKPHLSRYVHSYVILNSPRCFFVFESCTLYWFFFFPSVMERFFLRSVWHRILPLPLSLQDAPWF